MTTDTFGLDHALGACRGKDATSWNTNIAFRWGLRTLASVDIADIAFTCTDKRLLSTIQQTMHFLPPQALSPTKLLLANGNPLRSSAISFFFSAGKGSTDLWQEAGALPVQFSRFPSAYHPQGHVV